MCIRDRAGDYAYSLAPAAAENGFSQEQLEQLESLSGQAVDFAALLRQLQMDLNNGLVLLDLSLIHIFTPSSWASLSMASMMLSSSQLSRARKRGIISSRACFALSRLDLDFLWTKSSLS